MAEFDIALVEAGKAHSEFVSAHKQYEGTEAIYRRALDVRQQAKLARKAVLGQLEALIKQLKREQ